MRNPNGAFVNPPVDIDIRRSRIPIRSDFKFTMSAGKLYPCFVQEYLPGDTFSLDTSILCRMSTPIHPVMDNCFLDIFYFAVPNRLTWEHWKEFMGESPIDPYLSDVEYSVPQLRAPSEKTKVPFKSVADYMGWPAGYVAKTGTALPFRAFGLIWNEWFRDQNLQNAIDVDISDSNSFYPSVVEENNPDSYVTQTCIGGTLPPVNKFHDYFTSATLEAQKGDPVPIPINGFAPVYAIGTQQSLAFSEVGKNNEVRFTSPGGSYPSGTLGTVGTGRLRIDTSDALDGASPTQAAPSNLFADLSYVGGNGLANDVYATINDLRYAFQIQKLLENDNMYGTRYRELLLAHFGVLSPDQTMQIPEYLGGKRIRININQVLQTSATNEVSPQGNTAAYSMTADVTNSFTKSFTEHGYIIGVCCIRAEHSYQQGLSRMWSRSDRYSYYWPELAHIGNQPIYNREIFNYNPDDDEADISDEVFGFQEAWSEYRYFPSRIAGEFRSQYPQSLDVWHYGDYYESQPYLSSEWIREPRVNIDRTLAVSSDVSDQFICDFCFTGSAVRPMPVNSIPGITGHF